MRVIQTAWPDCFMVLPKGVVLTEQDKGAPSPLATSRTKDATSASDTQGGGGVGLKV